MFSIDQYLTSCQEPTVWQEGNQVLYDLCQQYPDHTDPGQIVAKTWLIGRAYSVALERRKGASESNEVYYREKIPQVFMSSKIDNLMLNLPKDAVLTEAWLDDVLNVHTSLVAHLKTNLDSRDEKDGLNRVSFCSKYLHFHRPVLFPIYDARAVRGLRILLKDYLPDLHLTMPYPVKYDRFCIAILAVLNTLNPELSKPLNLRQIDNLLLQLAESKDA